MSDFGAAKSRLLQYIDDPLVIVAGHFDICWPRDFTGIGAICNT